MHGLTRVIGVGIGAGLAAGVALANDFTFEGVPDGTVISATSPLMLVAPDDASLTATITPLDPGGFFTKQPHNIHFQAGSSGYLEENNVLPGGIKVCFNKPVFCVPGFPIGELPIVEITDPKVLWKTFRDGELVAEGEVLMEVDADSGLILADIEFPEGVIDCLELVATRSLVNGEPEAFPMMVGDFFAVAVDARCPGDWNQDLSLNDQDFFDFVNDFFSGNGPRSGADFNADGFQNDQDFFDFVNAFFTPLESCDA